MTLPNFIIAGAEKSGTTSLVFYLNDHHSIFIPSRKEINFFNNNKNYGNGIGWYEQWFADWSGEEAVGECTPLYMYDIKCAERISRDFPAMKIIFVLRNPVDRAYSNYWHQVRGGKEYLSFERALRSEAIRIKRDEFHDRTYSYVNKGLYYAQLQRFINEFPNKQIYILRLEDIKDRPQSTLNRVHHFLGVEPKIDQKGLGLVKNKTSIPKSRYLQYFAGKLFGHSIFFKVISRLNMAAGSTDYPNMSCEARKYLVARFARDIDKLTALTGIDFLAWRHDGIERI